MDFAGGFMQKTTNKINVYSNFIYLPWHSLGLCPAHKDKVGHRKQCRKRMDSKNHDMAYMAVAVHARH